MKTVKGLLLFLRGFDLGICRPTPCNKDPFSGVPWS